MAYTVVVAVTTMMTVSAAAAAKTTMDSGTSLLTTPVIRLRLRRHHRHRTLPLHLCYRVSFIPSSRLLRVTSLADVTRR